MKKLSTFLTVMGAVFVLAACTSNPESAAQKEMVKCGDFIHESPFEDTPDFTLTMKKDNTYSLYIKDYEKSFNEIVMETVEGTWSHVFTYEYKFDRVHTQGGIISITKTAVLGIYLMEGYTRMDGEGREIPVYFGYEKSAKKGNLFSTSEIINEAYLKSLRKSSTGVFSSNPGPVELPGTEFRAVEK